jgi:hypothetical protein
MKLKGRPAFDTESAKHKAGCELTSKAKKRSRQFFLMSFAFFRLQQASQMSFQKALTTSIGVL